MTITRKAELYKMIKILCSQLNYSMTTYRLSYKKSFTNYWEIELKKLIRDKVEKCQLQKMILNKYNIPRHLQFEIFKY
jgi:hypothetical protein